jgi:hypothetical protein
MDASDQNPSDAAAAAAYSSDDEANLTESEDDDDSEELEDREAMAVWFAIFRILDRLDARAASAGAAAVGFRIGQVRQELNVILDSGDMSLMALRQCRERMRGIEAEYMAAPPVPSPHPKHPLSVQNKELQLIRNMNKILEILNSLTDPVIRCRAAVPRRPLLRRDNV